MKKIFFTLLPVASFIGTALAWDGYGYDAGEYHTMDAERVREKYNGKVEDEVYDYNANSYRTFEMEER